MFQSEPKWWTDGMTLPFREPIKQSSENMHEIKLPPVVMHKLSLVQIEYMMLSDKMSLLSFEKVLPAVTE